MKKINTTNIVGAAKAPFLKKTFIHLNEAIAEPVSSVIKSLVDYTPGTVVILHGAVVTFPGSLPGTGSVTAGAAYINGEVYQIDANASISVGVGETLIWNIVATYDTANLPIDPVEYSNSVSYNQHEINKFVLSAGAPGSGLADYDDVITLDKLYDKAEQSEVDGIQTNKADKNQGSYTNITLINGWTGSLAYRKDQFGVVNIKGSINAVSSTAPDFFGSIPAIRYKSGNQGYIPITGKHNTNTTTIGGILWSTPSSAFINVNSYPNAIADFGVDVTYLVDITYFSE